RWLKALSPPKGVHGTISLACGLRRMRRLSVGTTREIAEFVTGTTFESLPASVVHEAKRDIINVLGVALYSARDESLGILVSMFDAEGGKERASIWGAGRKTTLANAALANGYTAHLEDYD